MPAPVTVGIALVAEQAPKKISLAFVVVAVALLDQVVAALAASPWLPWSKTRTPATSYTATYVSVADPVPPVNETTTLVCPETAPGSYQIAPPKIDTLEVSDVAACQLPAEPPRVIPVMVGAVPPCPPAVMHATSVFPVPVADSVTVAVPETGGEPSDVSTVAAAWMIVNGTVSPPLGQAGYPE